MDKPPPREDPFDQIGKLFLCFPELLIMVVIIVVVAAQPDIIQDLGMSKQDIAKSIRVVILIIIYVWAWGKYKPRA